MLSVRLPEPLERDLLRHCKAHRRTKSQVVQEALATFLTQAQTPPTPAAEPDLSFLAPDDPIREFIGIAKGGMSTDELMCMTRGDDWNRP